MDARYALATAIAAKQFGAISLAQLAKIGADKHVRRRWVKAGLLESLGPKSFAIVGSPATFERAAWGAMADVEGSGFVGGRASSRLHGLDGFDGDEVEVLVTRKKRGKHTSHRLASTSLPIPLADTIVVNGIRCLKAQRTILDAPLFAFTQAEIENAIDSAIRLKLVSEQRLRAAVIKRHRRGINHGRVLLDALVDTGGESRLERWFLRIVRDAGLPRPELQKVFRSDGRLIARVDAHFPGKVIVEVEGHGSHGSRRQRQLDEQRRTELTLQGNRVITFTYEDVRGRPEWVSGRLTEAVGTSPAA